MSTGGKLIEEARPELAAAVIDAVTDPFATIEGAARKSGLHPATTNHLVKRLKANYKPLNDELVKFKKNDLLMLLDDRIARTLQQLDEKEIATANAYQKTLIFAILFDKAQLLRGEPTQIVSHEQRQKIDELLPLLVDEARRRGVIDVEFKEVG